MACPCHYFHTVKETLVLINFFPMVDHNMLQIDICCEEELLMEMSEVTSWEETRWRSSSHRKKHFIYLVLLNNWKWLKCYDKSYDIELKFVGIEGTKVAFVVAWQVAQMVRAFGMNVWGFESPSGRDIFCLKNFDTLTKIPVRVSKINAMRAMNLPL